MGRSAETNLMRDAECSGQKEVIQIFKDYVRSKGWVLGKELSKAVTLYMVKQRAVESAEKEWDKRLSDKKEPDDKPA